MKKNIIYTGIHFGHGQSKMPKEKFGQGQIPCQKSGNRAYPGKNRYDKWGCPTCFGNLSSCISRANAQNNKFVLFCIDKHLLKLC